MLLSLLPFAGVIAVDRCVQDHLVQDIIKAGDPRLGLVCALAFLEPVVRLRLRGSGQIDAGSVHRKDIVSLEPGQVVLLLGIEVPEIEVAQFQKSIGIELKALLEIACGRNLLRIIRVEQSKESSDLPG